MNRVSRVRQVAAAVLLLAIGAAATNRKLAETELADVPDFTGIHSGANLEGVLVEVRAKDDAKVGGTQVAIEDEKLGLNCAGGCDPKVIIEVPEGFDTVSASGVNGLIKISDHDSDPMTCKAGLIEVPEFKVAVSGSTNVSLGCIKTPKITIVQSGQISAVSMWWTVETDTVVITNTGEGAQTHIIGSANKVIMQATGEKATVTVRDPDAVITGTSVGGRVYHMPGGSGSCSVSLPGPLGSACLELPTDEANVIRYLGLDSWRGVKSQSVEP